MPILPEDPKDREYLMMGLKITGDFGLSIAAPVVIFVLIGQWLDARYESGALFTIFAFLSAALLSGKMIYNKAKRYGKEYDRIENEEEKK